MRAYERFLQYVTINTQSDESSQTHPSFAGELDLAKKLRAELEEIGIRDTVLDENGYVTAFLPATVGCENTPAIGFISHMDTAPDYSGNGVKPVIHSNYDGGDVSYPCGKVMKAADFPHLKNLVGETLITSDGTTLLGADDKAGVAEIMTALEILIKENRHHGRISVAFTPDEEIGRGADLFDVEKFGADFAYTVDGGDVCEIEYENFNAATATVEFHGVSVHPGSAKNVMINASSAAFDFHAMLPEAERPEHTEGHEGFFHLTQMEGGVVFASLKYLVRDHDLEKFEEKKRFLKKCEEAVNEKYGNGTAVLTITDSYYNMLEKIKPHMHLIDTAKEAVKLEGLDSICVPVRGGTDGARLSYMGLPCPNLGTGGFNFHGPFEHITVERMDRATNVLLHVIALYAKQTV